MERELEVKGPDTLLFKDTTSGGSDTSRARLLMSHQKGVKERVNLDHVRRDSRRNGPIFLNRHGVQICISNKVQTKIQKEEWDH